MSVHSTTVSSLQQLPSEEQIHKSEEHVLDLVTISAQAYTQPYCYVLLETSDFLKSNNQLTKANYNACAQPNY